MYGSMTYSCGERCVSVRLRSFASPFLQTFSSQRVSYIMFRGEEMTQGDPPIDRILEISVLIDRLIVHPVKDVSALYPGRVRRAAGQNLSDIHASLNPALQARQSAGAEDRAWRRRTSRPAESLCKAAHPHRAGSAR